MVMAVERMPINPKVLTWVRDRAGYSVETLAKKRTDFKRIVEWEDGNIQPTYRQLELLSEVLQVPVAIFFFPKPPDTPPLQASFRTLENKQYDEIPPPVRLLLHKARAFQIGVHELNNGRNPASRLFTRDFVASSDESDDDLAIQIREFLAVNLQQQFKWTNRDFALKAWRRALYDVGIYVFRGPFKGHQYSGFCLYDTEFPVIFVNSSNSKARQIFTLLHELAHLLFRTSGIDMIDKSYVFHLPNDKRSVEVKCNRLAAYILVPNDVFDSELSMRNLSDDLPNELADLFQVSTEVIYRKLLDRKLISQEQYSKAKVNWAEGKSREKNGGDYYNNLVSYLGEEYTSLAFQRYYEEQISFEELADYLDTRPKNLEKLEHNILNRGL